MTAPSRDLILAALSVVVCGCTPSVPACGGDDATLNLRSVVLEASACADCEIVEFSDRLGPSEISVFKSMRLTIPICESNVEALKVVTGADAIEWKAEVQLDDETITRVRELAALRPESKYSLISRGDRALSVISTGTVGRSILVGQFASKLELEEALGIGTLREYPRQLDYTEDEESLKALEAADEALRRHAAEARVFERIERALKAGNEEEATKLLEEWKRQQGNEE